MENGVELHNSGDLDGLVSTYAEDGVEVTPLGTFEGREAIRHRMVDLQAAFPDMNLTPVAWVEEGDAVVMEYTWSGTHNGPLTLADGTELPPTGKRIDLPVVSVFQQRDGMTVSHRIYYDRMTTLTQLGVLGAS